MKVRLYIFAFVVAAMIPVVLYVGSEEFSHGQPAHYPGATNDSADLGRTRSFSLIDTHGAVVTDRSFRGNWLIVFFGFTHCVDICPAAQSNLSEALKALGDTASRVRVAFITVDPGRDSPQALHTYLQALGPQFIGLTGSAEEISKAEETFGAYAEKKSTTEDGNYTVKHSSTFFVLDPKGQLRRQISAQTTVADLTATLRRTMSPSERF